MKSKFSRYGAMLVAVAGLLVCSTLPLHAVIVITGGNNGSNDGSSTVDADPGECGKNEFNYSDAGITIVATGSVSCDHPSGTSFPVGTTTVECTDSADGTKDSFTVTVRDTQPPVVSVPVNSANETEPGLCVATVNFASSVSVADNCPGLGCATCAGPSVSCVPPSGTQFPIGTTAITCIGTDGSGNKHTNSFPVIVTDQENPEITVQGFQITSGGNPVPDIEVTVGGTDFCAGTSTATLDASAFDICSTASAVTCTTEAGGGGQVFVHGSTLPPGITRLFCTATDGFGNGALGSILFIVPSGAGDCADIGTTVDCARVRFKSNGQSQWASFNGNLTLLGGNQAADFRVNGLAKGAVKVTFGCTGTPTTVYCKTNISFKVKDHPADDDDDDSGQSDHEKWEYKGMSPEHIFFRLKDDQRYDALRDPNLPVSAATGNRNLGKLKTVFIHFDQTRFSYDFKNATKPVTITIDGIVLLTIRTNGTVYSPFPKWIYGKRVEVLYPGRLVPGNEICWFNDNDPNVDSVADAYGTLDNLVYCHVASASGTGTDTYFNAGGVFNITVPVSGININSEKCVKVEFQLGIAGVTPKVGCGMFTVNNFRKVQYNWKSGRCDGDDHDDDSHDGGDDDDDGCEGGDDGEDDDDD